MIKFPILVSLEFDAEILRPIESIRIIGARTDTTKNIFLNRNLKNKISTYVLTSYDSPLTVHRINIAVADKTCK